VRTVIHLVAAGENYTFSEREELSLGRADTADVRFASPYVSRRHGRLVHTDEGWVYEDLGSTRGTRFRGRPVERLTLVGPVTLLLGEPGKGEEVRITPENPAKIFICYRRQDAAGHAGRLRDRLAGAFGDSQVFLDIDQIEIGEDFVERTTSVVDSCRVFLVVIGPRWLDRDAHGRRRIDNPDDYVRIEIRSALHKTSQIVVLPVLVQGAQMPREEDLPDDLQALSRRNALVAPDERWRTEIDRLVENIEALIRISSGPDEDGSDSS
jgi:TIR domain-containing protein/FHA domain-containing protein